MVIVIVKLQELLFYSFEHELREFSLISEETSKEQL